MLDPRRWHATAEAGNGFSPPAPSPRVRWALLLGAAFLSIALGSAFGDPSAMGHLVAGLVLAATVQVGIVLLPWPAFLGLVATLFVLICWAINDTQYLNLFDAVLPALFALSLWGGARAAAIREDALLGGERHGALFRVTRQLERGGIVFNGLAVLSLINLFARFGKQPAITIGLFEVRMIYGVLVFPLALWWLRTEQRIRQALAIVAVAGVVLVVINLAQILMIHLPRAGMTWVINHPEWNIEDPNELGAGLSVICAMIVVRHRLRPSWWSYPLVGALLLLLALSESRSGLLAMVVFLGLSARSFRLRQVVLLLLLIAVVAITLPHGFKEKLVGTLFARRGTFHLYTVLIRIYGYQSAWRVFLDNWLIGVGYLGCRYVSQHYNDMHILNLGAENLFLETAAGLGVVGLAALGYLYVKVFQIGRVVRRLSPPRSIGSAFASLHVPLLTGLTIANLTGDNFVGFIGAGQVVLWCAMTIRAGHLSIEAERDGVPS